MSDARFALLRAVRLAVLQNTELAAALTGVYDQPPRGVGYPFVTFGETRSAPLDGDDEPVQEHQIELWIHSRGRGRWEVSDLADRIRELLDDGALVLAGQQLVSIRHRSTEIEPSRDRRGFRARMRMRAVTQAND